MSCEAVQTLLLEMPAQLPEDAQAHLKGCADCTALVKEMSLVHELTAMPRPAPGVRGRLAGMEQAVRVALNEKERRVSTWRRGASLAVAAGLGALVAGLALSSAQPRPGPVTVSATVENVWESPFTTDEGLGPSSDDELFDEVLWPSSDEGDL